MLKKVFVVVCSAALCASAMAQTGAAPKAMPMGKEVSATGKAWLPGNFKIEIDGKVVPGAQVSDPATLQAQASMERSRPGNSKPGKITVTKDWSNTSEWYTWRKSVMDGKVDRKSISVIFMNDAGMEAGRMNFYDCFPTNYIAPEMNARSSGHATEKLEISYERFEMK